MKAPYRELLEALRERLPAHKLIDDPLRLLAYGTDASFYRLIPDACQACWNLESGGF